MQHIQPEPPFSFGSTVNPQEIIKALAQKKRDYSDLSTEERRAILDTRSLSCLTPGDEWLREFIKKRVAELNLDPDAGARTESANGTMSSAALNWAQYINTGHATSKGHLSRKSAKAKRTFQELFKKLGASVRNLSDLEKIPALAGWG